MDQKRKNNSSNALSVSPTSEAGGLGVRRAGCQAPEESAAELNASRQGAMMRL